MSRSSSSQSVKCPAETSSAWVMEEASGSHRFEITRYSQAAKFAGSGDYIESAGFCVGGHTWTIRCSPNNRTYSGSPCIGLSVALSSDAAANVRALYKLELVDQNGYSVLKAPEDVVMFAYRGQCHGGSFLTSELSRFLIDDRLIVRCTVTVLSDPRAVPKRLKQHLESGKGADVAFQVCGTTFAAHRCVLAARSPVFKAQLFGRMKERSMQCKKIEEMDDAVFKALLHFIYSYSVPPEMEDSQNSSSTDGSASAFCSRQRKG